MDVWTPSLKVLAAVSLLLPSFATAACSSSSSEAHLCASRQEAHDETSLLQVNRAVKSGSERTEQLAKPLVVDKAFVDKAAQGLALPGLPESALAAKAAQTLAKFATAPAQGIADLTTETPVNIEAVAPGINPGGAAFRYVMPGVASGMAPTAGVGAGALPNGMTFGPGSLTMDSPSGSVSTNGETFGPGSLTLDTPAKSAGPGAPSIEGALQPSALPSMDAQQYVPVQAVVPGATPGDSQRLVPAYMVMSPGSGISEYAPGIGNSVFPTGAVPVLQNAMVKAANAENEAERGISGYSPGISNSVFPTGAVPVMQKAMVRAASAEKEAERAQSTVDERNAAIVTRAAEAGMSNRASMPSQARVREIKEKKVDVEAEKRTPAAMAKAERRVAEKAIEIYKEAEARNRAIAKAAAERAAAEKVAAAAEKAVAKAAARTAAAAKAAQSAEKVVADLNDERNHKHHY